MITVKIKKVFESIVRQVGLDPDNAGFSAAQQANYADLINERLEQGWESAFWPEVMKTEQREYRPTWDTTENYATDDEVYYDEKYYSSVQDGNSGNTPDPDDDTWWDEVGDDFQRTIDFQQDGETQINGVDVENCIYDRDPRVFPTTQALSYVEQYESNVIVKTYEAPVQPYLRFRPEPVEFSLTEWVADTEYAIGDLTYLDAQGESYKAIASSTGKDPYTETAYWQPVNFPKFMRQYVKHAVAGDLLSEDEGRFKEWQRAEKILDELKDVLIDQVKVRRVGYRGV